MKSSSPHASPGKGNDKMEKMVQNSFSKVILTDYSQVLGNAAAYGISTHRVKLAKLQEISNMEPNYKPESSL